MTNEIYKTVQNAFGKHVFSNLERTFSPLCNICSGIFFLSETVAF